mmetsp:Transcript_106097/g.310188  ORF Transcript_106097/g.310188 Transcript_106097/m.310188 type:complete len:328 (+) Transcript_106097:128-1111(+)
MDGSRVPAHVDELPGPLAPLDVPEFLQPYGYHASSHLSWGRQQPPELTIQVSSHSTIGKHTYYHLECTLARVRGTEEKHVWKVARRLAHLREGLHDPLKRALGSSYQTYFCGVHFAHHLRPAGTTARLDAWCSRLAHCITAKLAPPEIAAVTLRVLDAPSLTEQSESGGNAGGGANADRHARAPELPGLAHSLGAMSGLPGSCGTVGVGSVTGFFDCGREGADDGDIGSLDPDKDTLASEGASASTADPCSGGIAASFHPAYSAVASPGGTSNYSAGSDDSGDEAEGNEADGEEMDDEELAEAVYKKVTDSASFDPYGGRRRPLPLQ